MHAKIVASIIIVYLSGVINMKVLLSIELGNEQNYPVQTMSAFWCSCV